MNNHDDDKRIPFLLKSMKREHVKDTMKKGRFCFNHPTLFNKWDRAESAQFDRYDSHSAYKATHIMYAPLLGEENGKPQYGEVKTLAEEGIIRLQSNIVKHMPICCFRAIEEKDITIEDGVIVYSLEGIGERIWKEFGHDSYVFIHADSLLKRIREKSRCMTGCVVYRDVLNDYEFSGPEDYKEIFEQLYRKDKKYEWQKEFRIALPPTEDDQVFIEIGSIEDIAVCGQLMHY